MSTNGVINAQKNLPYPKKILITYGDKHYYDSIIRLKKQADLIGIFDEIIIYTDADLPGILKNHELMQYKRGGGHWLWKPYIIKDALGKLSNDRDIIIYSDAGNELFKHTEWLEWFCLLEKNSAICFKYGAVMKKWCRKNLLDYYADSCHNLHEMYQCMGGLSLWTRRALPIVNEWFDIMFNYPDFVKDVPEDQKREQYREFYEHRHDQAVLSCAYRKHMKEYNAILLWQTSESYRPNGQAVFNARISNDSVRNPRKVRSLASRIAAMIAIPIRELKEFLYRHLL